MKSWITTSRRACIGFGLALTALGAGCVERILQVRSDPPGATVYLNGEEVGVTPLDHRFHFYGTVALDFRREGSVSRQVAKALDPPWYEVFPLDFVSEVLLPVPLKDVHTVEAKLIASPGELNAGEKEKLEKKAEELRSEASGEEKKKAEAEAAKPQEKKPQEAGP